MRCEFENSTAEGAERSVVDEWIMATECTGVTEIIVERHAVILHGTRHQPCDMSATALRHGNLFVELTEALDAMRQSAHRDPLLL